MGIISPKPNSFVGQGETVEIVVAGEESKPASTWQTGIRRLTLVEPAPAMNIQNSDETATSVCDGKQWTRQHSFRYVVPRDAQSGQVLTLKAAAEDGAKNIGFATLDLIVQQGYAGLWTTKGRDKTDQREETWTIKAAFSFTFRSTGAVECGTASRPYCGSASVTFDQGRAKDCVWTRTPSFVGGIKIRVTGIRKGNELTHLSFRRSKRFRLPTTGIAPHINPTAGVMWMWLSGRFGPKESRSRFRSATIRQSISTSPSWA